MTAFAAAVGAELDENHPYNICSSAVTSIEDLLTAYEKDWVYDVYIPFVLALNASGKVVWWTLSRNSNITMDIVCDHEDLPWSSLGISCNCNFEYDIISKRSPPWYFTEISARVPLETINAHPAAKWDWVAVNKNPNLTVDFIRNNLDKPWDWKKLVVRPDLLLGVLEICSSDLEPDLSRAALQTLKWYVISMSPTIDMEFINKHPDLPWDWAGINRNPNLTMDMVLAHPEKQWVWSLVSKNPNLNMAVVNSQPINAWSWERVSANRGITMDDVVTHPEKPWDWEMLAWNPNITLEMMTKKPPSNGWNWFAISRNQGLCLEILDQFPDASWDWLGLSSNHRLTIEMLCAHPHKPWNWRAISWNPAVTMEMMQRFPDKAWDFGGLSRKPSLTTEMVLKMAEMPWDWEAVFLNALPVERAAYGAWKLRRLGLLSLMDEDYHRAEGVLDRTSPIDLVLQSEIIVSIIYQFV